MPYEPLLDLNKFNEVTLKNLTDQLDRVYTSNNLLVLDPILSPLINRLASFLIIKEHAKCQNVAWLNDDLLKIPIDVVSKYSSLVILIPESLENLGKLKSYIPTIAKKAHGLRYNLIVKDLSKTFVFQVNQQFEGIIDFEKILNLNNNNNNNNNNEYQYYDNEDKNKIEFENENENENENEKKEKRMHMMIMKNNEKKKTMPLVPRPLSITSKIKLFDWKTDPIYTDGILVTEETSQFSGLNDYFERPLKQLNQLSDALIKLLFYGIKPNDKHRHHFKLRNIYGKGNHSELFIKMLRESQIPSFLSENMQTTEIEFYQDKLHSNTDLVVIERNVDLFPVIFSQLNYHGIIDDMFGINFETIVKFEGGISNKDLANDELYNNDLKHLNFSTVGARLNRLAKYIKQRFENTGRNDDDANINEMKNLVGALGNLTQQQELLKKHTLIGESIVGKVETDYEKFLTFQNDVFDMDYKLQISNLKLFLNNNYPIENIWTIILLIGYINDGIMNTDLEMIMTEIHENYGFSAVLSLQRLIDLKLIRKVNDSSNDFFASLGLTSQKKHAATPQVDEDDSDVGISGCKDVFKSNYTLINKFWNLHPLPEEEQEGEEEEEKGGLGRGKNRRVEDGRGDNDDDNNDDNHHNNNNDDNSRKDNKGVNGQGRNYNKMNGLKSNNTHGNEIKQGTSILKLYPTPSFTLPGNTVPIIYRMIESLYFRDFLKYKPVNNIKRRPNWDNLGLNTMFAGKTIDVNLENVNDDKLKYLVIVIIGGITRSEMTCLKYLEERLKQRKNGSGASKKVIVLTNGIINNRKLWQFIDQ